MLSTEQLKEKMKECSKRIKNTARACQDFYSKYLQGESVSGTVDGEKVPIAFTKRGKDKLFNLVDRKHIVKEILPYIPDIITTGKCMGYLNGYKAGIGHRYFDGFLYFTKTVSIPQGQAKVIVDVGVIKQFDNRQEYSFISDQDDGFVYKVEKLKEAGITESVRVEKSDVIGGHFHTPTGVTLRCPKPHISDAQSDATIPLSFEFVNVRIENIFGSALESAYANEFHDNFSDLNYAFKLEL